MRTLFLCLTLSILFCSCLPSAENTSTFKRIETQELSARTKLAQIEQEYASCEKRERNFLMQLNLPQAQAYANFKDAFKSLDQTKVYLALLQMKESFGNALKDRFLFDIGKSLVIELSKLDSDINRAKFYLKETSNLKEEYLFNYNKLK